MSDYKRTRSLSLTAHKKLGARNRFRLRRPSPFAEFELRVEDWRVFCRVVGDEVQVAMIGRNQRIVLIVNGKRFIL